MKLKISIFVAMVALSMTIFSPPVSALSDAKKGAITQNCNSIKTSLTSVQKSDSKTRVLLGTSYQTVLTNLLTPLNIRLIKANLSDSTLSTAQANIASEWASFQEQFIKYSQSLEGLISVDCKADPEQFHEKLEQTRSARRSLNKIAIKINKLITSSATTITDLRNSLNQGKEAKDESL